MNILHIYGQGCQHEDVQIYGTSEALRELANVILCATNTGMALQTKNLFVNDGEGFRVVVECLKPEACNGLVVPYTRPWPWRKQ